MNTTAFRPQDAALPREDSAEINAPLPPAIDAEEGTLDILREGRVHYYADREGEGTPLLLVHSVNAAASAYEMRPLFEALRGRRPVYAIDLPGFGRSDRARRDYTAEGYADVIERVVVDLAAPRGGGCDVVALSLASEFAARVAVRTPELVRRLTLLSPSGLSSRRAPPFAEALRRRLLAPLLHVGPVGRGLFLLLRTERSVRHFLAKSFTGPVDEGLVRYAVRSAQAPGAEHAPIAFLSGGLFDPEAFERLYAPLAVPTTVVHDVDPYTDFGRLGDLTARNPNVRAVRVAPSRGLVHFEQPEKVADIILAAADGPHGAPEGRAR